MKYLDRAAIQARRSELEAAQTEAYNEYQQISGAIRLLDVFLQELDQPEAQANEAGKPPAEGV